MKNREKYRKTFRCTLLTGVMVLALFNLFGCGRKPLTNPDPSTETGGKVDRSYDAPKIIDSKNIVSFKTLFFKFGIDGSYDSGRAYRFEATRKEDGTPVLAEVGQLGIQCEAGDDFFDEIYKVLCDYSLFELNGQDCYTSGLPPEYQPTSLTAVFDSGEKLYFNVNGAPDDDWSDVLAELFAETFAAAGDTSLKVTLLGEPFELGDAQVMQLKFTEIGMARMPWMIIEDMVGEYVCYMCDDEDGLHPYNDFSISVDEARQFFDKLFELGIPRWNGFSRSRSLGSEVLDADTSFEFYMLLDDGREIRADGYNCFPENYDKMKLLLMDLWDRE